MANIHDYYRKNFLYESHRLMLPELRGKVTRTCAECKFFVQVAGRTGEKRPACAALIPEYANLSRRVPKELDVFAVLEAVGREGLERVIAGADPLRRACGFFHPRA